MLLVDKLGALGFPGAEMSLPNAALAERRITDRNSVFQMLTAWRAPLMAHGRTP